MPCTDATANPNCERTDNAMVTVSPQEPVLTLTKTVVNDNDGPGPGDGAVLRDPAVAGVDCTAATLTCSASGGAVCPASLNVESLQSTGLVIPTFPVGGALQFGMACTVTATGQ